MLVMGGGGGGGKGFFRVEFLPILVCLGLGDCCLL